MYNVHVAGGNSYGIVIRENTVGLHVEGTTHAIQAMGSIVASGDIIAAHT